MKALYHFVLLLLLSVSSLKSSAQGNQLKSVQAEVNPIVSAEFFFNIDPGVGKGTALVINSSEILTASLSIPTTGLLPGFNNLFIRVKDVENNWSLSEGRTLYIKPIHEPASPALITLGEYFFDTDPGTGKGTSLSVTSSENISSNNSIPVSGLAPGFHTLFVRYKDISNNWSLSEGRTVYIKPATTTARIAPIVKGEYFFNVDPGIGKGFQFSDFTSSESINITQQIAFADLTDGKHNLFVRTMDSTGVWSLSMANQESFIISSTPYISTEEITIYPNPVVSEFRIEGIEPPYRIEIVDITGKSLQIREITAFESIMIGNLNSGTYILKLSTVNGIINKRILIQTTKP